MERKTRLIAKYSQRGHYMYPEDTWDDSCQIKNEKDLLYVMKDWHKQSASKFNDAPLGGLFSPNALTFEIEHIIVDDDGSIFYGKKEDCAKPDYFDSAKESFEKWYKAISERLPKLRQARSNRLKEESERKKLKELSEKYNK